MLRNNVLEAVGGTPLIKLNYVAKDLECDLYGKCEFLNPSGSLKDRMVKRMILEKIKSGEIRKGTTIIEATSGNTGIAVAMVGACLGYRVIITLSKKNSGEKTRILRALNAEVIETPIDAHHTSPEDYINVAKRLSKTIPNAVYLGQYDNKFNAVEHYESTAEEIIQQCGGSLDMFVVATGTGGCACGVSKKLKEKVPQCKVVGADPEGSFMANANDAIGPYFVEGIGYDFLPGNFDRKLIDQWVKTNDYDSFKTAREVIKKEGLLVGGSCGATISAALKAAKSLKKGQKCVVILADSSKNYLTKFLDDGWMKFNGFMDFEISELEKDFSPYKVSAIPVENTSKVGLDSTCREAFDSMIEKNIEFISVMDSNGKLVGVVQRRELRNNLEDFNKKQIKDCLKEAFVLKNVAKLNSSDPLNEMAAKLSKSQVVAVYKETENLFLGLVEKFKLWRYAKK